MLNLSLQDKYQYKITFLMTDLIVFMFSKVFLGFAAFQFFFKMFFFFFELEFEYLSSSNLKELLNHDG